MVTGPSSSQKQTVTNILYLYKTNVAVWKVTDQFLYRNLLSSNFLSSNYFTHLLGNTMRFFKIYLNYLRSKIIFLNLKL